MPYRPHQLCPVCGEPIRPRDPVTSSFAGDPAQGRNHLVIVHRRCEAAMITCRGCGKTFGEDEQRVCEGGVRCWHWHCLPARDIASSGSHVPNVRVFLRRKDPLWQWVIPACPQCGEEHAHFAGMVDEDPRKRLGPRPYLCRNIPLDDPIPEYNLVDADPTGTARTLEECRQGEAA